MNPYVQDGTLTMATCKWQIRLRCQVGDWVVVYGPAGASGPGPVRFIFRVDQKVDFLKYMRDFQGHRDDAIYATDDKGSKLERIAGGRFPYHRDPEDLTKDKKGRFVLCSSTFLSSPDLETGHPLLDVGFRRFPNRNYATGFPSTAARAECLSLLDLMTANKAGPLAGKRSAVSGGGM